MTETTRRDHYRTATEVEASGFLPVCVSTMRDGPDCNSHDHIPGAPLPKDDEPPRVALLLEAARIIDGSRDLSYGTPEANQARIAALWSVLFGIDITPRQACLALVLVKVARDIHTPKRDNLVDIAGYAAIATEVPG